MTNANSIVNGDEPPRTRGLIINLMARYNSLQVPNRHSMHNQMDLQLHIFTCLFYHTKGLKTSYS